MTSKTNGNGSVITKWLAVIVALTGLFAGLSGMSWSYAYATHEAVDVVEKKQIKIDTRYEEILRRLDRIEKKIE